MEKNNTGRVIGYARVSVASQIQDGVSLDAQKVKLEQFCALHDLELVDVITDPGASAKSLDRPGLKKALAALTAGVASGLVIAKLDRLTRRVSDLGNLLDVYFKDEFALMSVGEAIRTDTASGRLVLHVLMSVAQWEREAIGERTKDALSHLKNQGVQLGGEALGWQRTNERDENGRFVIEPVPEELEIVDQIIELRGSGLALRAIARHLELAGVPTKRGGRWSHRTVARILHRQVGAA